MIIFCSYKFVFLYTAIKIPNYEIRGSVTYITDDVNGCTHDIIIPIKKKLPDIIKTEICPDGPLQYACNVVVETPKCFEDKVILNMCNLYSSSVSCGVIKGG